MNDSPSSPRTTKGRKAILLLALGTVLLLLIPALRYFLPAQGSGSDLGEHAPLADERIQEENRQTARLSQADVPLPQNETNETIQSVPQQSTRKRAASDFVATIHVLPEIGSLPSAEGMLYLVPKGGDLDEEIDVPIADGVAEARLPDGTYLVDTVVSPDWPRDFAVVGTAEISAQNPQVTVQLKPAPSDLYATLNVVHFDSGEPLQDVQVYLQKGQSYEWPRDDSLTVFNSQGTILSPFEPKSAQDLPNWRQGPKQNADVWRKGPSPLSIPLATEGNWLCIGAPGFAWREVPLPQAAAEIKVALLPAGTLLLLVDGDELPQDGRGQMVLIDVNCNGNSRRMRLPLQKRIDVGTIPAGQAVVTVRQHVGFGTGVVWVRQSFEMPAGETYELPMTLAQNPASSLSIRLLSTHSNLPKIDATWEFPDTQGPSTRKRSQSSRERLPGFTQEPAPPSGFLTQSYSQFSNLQPGQYVLRISPFPQAHSVSLLPGQNTELTIDLSSARETQITLVPTSKERVPQERIILEWEAQAGSLQGQNLRKQYTYVTNGSGSLWTMPGTYHVSSQSKAWNLPEPVVFVPAAGSEEIAIPIEWSSVPSAKFRLSLPYENRGFARVDSATLQFEAIEHGGQNVSVEIGLSLSPALSPARSGGTVWSVATYTAFFDNPGRYRVSSSKDQFHAFEIAVPSTEIYEAEAVR